MGRFFFHVRDGDDYLEDLVGMELPGLLAARDEALTSAREIIAARILSGEVLNGQVFEVCDEMGQTVAIVPFKAVIPD